MNISPEKLFFIAVVALLVLGPQRLPAVARSVGKMLGELRRLTGGLQGEMRDALAEPRQIFQEAMGEADLRSVTGSVSDSVRGLLNPPDAPVPASPDGASAVAERAPTESPPGPTSLPTPPDDPSLN